MRNLKKIYLVLAVCLILSVFGTSIQVDAATTVGKTTIKEVDNIDTTTQKITWKKLKNVSGYQIYYKKSDGSYKKLATVGKSKCSYVIKNLNTNTKYFYKVRAYKKVNKKTKYGNFSSQIGKKTTDYLVNLYDPYYVNDYNSWYCAYQYKSPNMFSMGGEEYTNGITLDCQCSLFYNLKGTYKTISFTMGTTDVQERVVAILADDETVFVENIGGLSLPKTYTVNIENASKLEFRDITTPNTSPDCFVGLANIRLYK